MSPQVCRLILDGPADGAWNMAVDETLLALAARDGGPILRFYGWSEPTLSLGYFQPYGDRQGHPPSRACPVVRRPSGGGAIVHDRELTYSFAVPVAHPLARPPDALYRLFHETLAEALPPPDGRPPAGLWTGPAHAAGAFLCFERRAAGDLVCEAAKIAGSAQRRRRGALVQHGGVLLACSAAAPDLPGWEDLCGAPCPAAALIAAWCDRLARRAGLAWRTLPLGPEESRLAGLLADTKYRRPGWTRRR
jgi:lipoate-protein ligase A